MSQLLTATCLCRGVKFRITGPLFEAAYCHCSMCRKAHGSAFRARALVRASDFAWIRGEELVSDYASSFGTHRTFCRNCGSPLIARSDRNPDILNLALGTLDDDPGIRPTSHWYVASKAPWFAITDDLCKYAEEPPAEDQASPAASGL